MTSTIIELREVNKTYSTAAGDFVALKDVNLKVNAGEFLGIVGKSGAGKSTLLNMINGVDQLTSGQVFVHTDGKNLSVHDMGEDARALWRGQNMGVVYQSFQLLPMLTLVENIMLPMDLSNNFHPRRSRDRAMELLELVELEEHANKPPAFISGGQQQRVAIARALMTEPPILLADEPTGNLDSRTSVEVMEIFQRLRIERGITVILITHDHDIAEYGSRVISFKDGYVVSDSQNDSWRVASTELTDMPLVTA
jgi:putative ABC transport system ATP-binding protein